MSTLPTHLRESRYPAILLSERAQRLALTALCLILGGILALPMLPGWQGLGRVLAGAVLMAALPAIVPRTVLRTAMAVVVLAGLLVVAGWLQSAVSNPGRHVIGMITDIYGLALPIYAGIALTVIDAMLLGGLGVLLLGQDTANRVRLGYGMALFVWAYSLSAPVVLGLSGARTVEFINQMLAGSSEWAGWIMLMGLCLALVRHTADIRTLIFAIILGGLAMAVVMVLQIALGDFNYVLDAPNLQDYFYRVRGTAYYHAPATYTVAIVLMLCVGLFHANRGGDNGPRSHWHWGLLALALAALVAFNDTRALNVALVVALCLMVLIVLWRADWRCLVLALVLTAGIGADMLYVKPIIGGQVSSTLPDAALAERIDRTDLSAVQVLKVEQEITLPSLLQPTDDKKPTLVQSNSLRVIMIRTGLAMLPRHLLIGSGIGTLDLDLGGQASIGVTYSSHTLYLDMALMAGVPALMAFLGLLTLASLAGIRLCLRRDRGSGQSLAPASLCALVALGLGAVFLPQERNHIVALFFVFSALLLALEARQSGLGASNPSHHALGRSARAPISLTIWGAVLALGAIGWGVLTSATYTLPVLNLVARNATDIANANSRVYVTESATIPLVKALLRLRGVQDPQVQMLLDDPGALPSDNSYVIWLPARDKDYPKLRQAFGYRLVRPGSDAPSLETPPSWWMMPVIPYAGYLLHAGARPVEEAFPETAAATELQAGLRLWPNGGRFIGFAQRGSAAAMLARDLLDMNISTARFWATYAPPEFYFDMGPLGPVPIGAYRLVAPPKAYTAHSRSISWTLEGSDDLQDWVTLDSRTAILSVNAEEPSGFAISNPRVFSYLRMKFVPQSTNPMMVGLSEIEFYPTPATGTSSGLQTQ